MLLTTSTQRFAVFSVSSTAARTPTPPTSTSTATTAKQPYMTDRLASTTRSAPVIDYTDPHVLATLEPDFAKARATRAAFQTQDAQRGYPEKLIDACSSDAGFRALTEETDFHFDSAAHPLAEALAEVLGLPGGAAALPTLHTVYNRDVGRLKDRDEKARLLQPLTDPARHRTFHTSFVRFVRGVVAPHVHAVAGCTRLHFQAFPCVRVVRPKEFSIGVHCDAAYGFDQANINFYVPLTPISGTNSLVLESYPGREDWHTIEATYGHVKRFYGAQCLHFTPGNTTHTTRVSLDFRVILDHCWRGDHDHFTSAPGYYAVCVLDEATGAWAVEGDIPAPDWRVGFPFERGARA